LVFLIHTLICNNASPLQQWFQGRAPVLRYTYTARPVTASSTYHCPTKW